MVKSQSCNAEDAGSIPGQGTKIPRATGQLSPCATTREKPEHGERSLSTATKSPRASTKTQGSQKKEDQRRWHLVGPS